jgi:hypothetical protein
MGTFDLSAMNLHVSHTHTHTHTPKFVANNASEATINSTSIHKQVSAKVYESNTTFTFKMTNIISNI